MFRDRWTYLATLLAAFVTVFFYPAKGFSVEEDPYLYRMLVGTIYFEYEKSNFITDQYKMKNSHFTERYQLETVGNLVSRKVFIYDASTVYTNVNNDMNGSKSETDNINYRVKTTILPVSAIPLTLYGTRSENTSSNSSATNKGTNTGYGLEWRLLTKTLPKLQLTIDTTETETADSKSTNTATNLDLEKEIGPTTNEIFLRKNESKASSGDKSSTRQVNAMHGTKVSKNTAFSAGGSRSDSQSNTSGETAHEGYSFSLNSAPSKDFKQNHTYFYYKTSDEGRSDGTTYSGNMSYTISKDLSASASVGISKTESDTASSQSKSANNSTNGSISYSLTRTISLSENVSYSNSETNSSSSTSTNTSDNKTFSSATTASYGDSFSWTSFGISYGGTYVKEEVGEITSTSTGQSGSAGLSNIDFNRYIGLNTSASFSESESSSGDTNTNTRAYNFSFFNKALVKYITLTGSANKSTTSSWIEGMDQKSETYRLDATSNLTHILALSGYAERLKNFNDKNGWANVDNTGVNISKKTNIFGGPLDLSASYRLTEREYIGGNDRSATVFYRANYSRPLLGLMSWQFDSSISEKRDNQQISRMTNIQNSLVYPLRAWLLSLDHRYILSETTTQDSNENIYMIKAARSFVRYL